MSTGVVEFVANASLLSMYVVREASGGSGSHSHNPEDRLILSVQTAGASAPAASSLRCMWDANGLAPLRTLSMSRDVDTSTMVLRPNALLAGRQVTFRVACSSVRY